MLGLALTAPPEQPSYASAKTFTASVRIGAATGGAGTLTVPIAPTATANYGLVSLGSGAFDGTTSGFYVGNASGTHIAVNTASGYGGRMLDLQVAGNRMFAVGRPTVASGASVTLRAIEVSAQTITITGSTNITTAAGFNMVELGQPTYSNASVVVTSAATLAVLAAPTATGGASITNAYALWVQGGTTRYDGPLQQTYTSIVSTPASLLTGTWYTGGTATTTKPHLHVEPSGATSSNWSTAGTGLGVNAASGFTGNLADFQLNAGSRWKVSSTGAVTQAGNLQIPDGGTVNVSGGPNISLSTGTTAGCLVTTGGVSGGTVGLKLASGAYVNMTAEKSDLLIAAHTDTITGSYATQRMALFDVATFTAITSTRTITTGIALEVASAPTVSGTAAITNVYALNVASSGPTVANIAGTLYAAINVPAHTVTLAATTQMTAAGAAVAAVALASVTVAQSGGAVTVNNVATLYIAGALTAGSSVTITNNYGLWLDSGRFRWDDNIAAPSTSVGATLVNYYGTAATNFLGDPNIWLRVNIGGTDYKIPCYS